MTILTYILVAVIGLPISWFFWSVAHELSHVLMAKAFREVTSVDYRLYPHRTPSGSFRFAAVRFWYAGEDLTPKQTAVILQAPRIMNLVAVFAVLFSALFPGPVALGWAIFWGAGLVDLFVNSIGSNKESDLRRSAAALGWNPWYLRIIGFAWFLTAVVATIGIALVVLL